MVTFPGTPPEVMLPEMRHFMGERREDFGKCPRCKVRRVRSDFISNIFRINRICEALSGEKTIGAGVPLYGNEAGGKLPAKSSRLKKS
jgi:hypothetical protein